MSDSGSKQSLSKKLSSFMENHGNVTFIVGEEQKEFRASSQILSALSPVFNVMFSEPWKSKSEVVKVPDVHPKIFGYFLELMINDLTLDQFLDLQLQTGEIIGLLYVAKKYDVASILSCCKKAIKKMLTIHSAAYIFEQLEFLNEPKLQRRAFHLIEKNADEFFKTTEFLAASRGLLFKVLKSSQLKVEEIAAFKAIVTWSEHGLTQQSKVICAGNIREFLGDLLSLIRFPIMSHKDLAKYVGPTLLLTDKELLLLHEYIALAGHPNRSSKLNHLPFSAMPRYGCKPIYIVLSPRQRRKIDETEENDSDSDIEDLTFSD